MKKKLFFMKNKRCYETYVDGNYVFNNISQDEALTSRLETYIFIMA